jgi:ribosomal protein S12 methylthiotransferase accessory factor
VSPYTGIVGGLRDLLRATDDDRLVKVGADTSPGDWLLGQELDHLTAGSGGAATGRAPALAAALGEAVERYSASYIPAEQLVLASASELGSEALDPSRFALFSADQLASAGFPFEPFTSDTRVRWVRGFAVPSGAPAWFPAQLVYLSWRRLATGEAPIAYATSSGTACACTPDEAVLAGLLELVERDAFMIVWANRLSLPRLDWTASTDLGELAARYFDPSGLSYAAVDLSGILDVPTVLGVVRGGDGPLGVGAAAAPTVEEAWLKALAEAFSVRSWVCSLPLDSRWPPGHVDFGDVRTFTDHVRFYADPERAAAADFLDCSAAARDVTCVPPLDGSCVSDWIDCLGDRITAAGAAAYAVDVTAPDVAAAGLCVVKTLSPELCMLDVAYDGRFLGGPRLVRAAHERGLRPAPLAPGEINPYPHPFP